MQTITMKFGGTSVGSVEAINNVVYIVRREIERGNRVIVVVSAMSGVTDMLLSSVMMAAEGDKWGYLSIAEKLRDRHHEALNRLAKAGEAREKVHDAVNRLIDEYVELCHAINILGEATPRIYDAITAFGERMSARVVAAALRDASVTARAYDATQFVITDDQYQNAVPYWPETENRIRTQLMPIIESGTTPIITGFIGATHNGATTTLGRGGSDFTASLMAVTAGASELWVWTDVDGIMTADPNDIPQARSIAELSYDEMGELAYFGAKVLHQRMVAPLKEHGIPLCIKNVYKPQQSGTWISAKPTPQQRIKAVTRIQGILLTTDSSGTVSQVSQLVDEAMFNSIGVHADVMIAAQASRRSLLCYIIPTSAGPDVGRLVELAVSARLTQSTQEHTWNVQQATVITAVGADLNSSTGVIAGVLQALDGLRILAVSQNPVWCAVSIVVEPRDSDVVLQRLHALTL